MTKPRATVSVDLDNLWTYQRTHGDPEWERLGSYLHTAIPRMLDALDEAGCQDVGVEETGGMLSDHYDPRHRVLRLSHDVYHGRSATSVDIACHEAGHALQHAQNYAPLGIRVNGVNPGVILTPFHERFTNEEQMKRMVDTITMKRAGTSEETATVIAFLASSDAKYLTGETIEVNGGQLMD